MDSITHIAVGACIGEAFFEKGFGKKAMWWGMLAQSAPDIDFIAGFWMNTPETLMAHRGFTHSFLFGFLIVPILAWVADRIHRPHEIMFKKWLLFFFVEVFVHLFLDGFNNYGVGWFEPFTHERFSFNAIYVADPFFSVWPGVALIVLLILHKHHPKRTFWWRFGVVLPAGYLVYCCINKINVNHRVDKVLAEKEIAHDRYFTTPAPLQNWMWFVVAEQGDGYNVGYCSIFDKTRDIDFTYFPKQDELLEQHKDDPDLKRLIIFSQDYYTVEKWHDTLIFNDLRFGQVQGWKDPNEKFAFHYYLNFPDANDLVVQRGRFAGWDFASLETFWERLKGN